MRAVGLMQYGGPEVLQVVDVPEVHAGPGQVRIRVHAAAVNPTDVGTRNGSRAEQQKADPPPYVPGMDVAGIVDEVGAGVATGVQVGDAVMGIVVPKGSHGGYREPDWSLLHAVSGLRLHLYGKHHARPGRKMGHFTVTGDDADEVLERALQARTAIGIRDE